MEPLALQDRSRSTDEMQHVSSMQTGSNCDSRPFRRSQRLQSLLGKMRDSTDDEWGRSHAEGNKFVALSQIRSQGGDHREAHEDRNDQNSEETLEGNITPPVRDVQTTQAQELCRQVPDKLDEIQAREEEIREQIHVAVQDIIIGNTGEGKRESPRALETTNSNHPAEPVENASPTGQVVTRPKSPPKGSTSKKPAWSSRSGSVSPKKQSESPKSQTKMASKRNLAKSRNGNKTFPRKKALQDDLMDDSSESELSTDQRPLLSPRESKTPKTSRKNTENKSMSSDDSTNASASSSDSSDNDSASVASTGTSSDGYSTSSSLKQRESTINIKATHLAVDTADTSAEPSKVASPIAEQASDFIKNLVKNLTLHQSFRVPEKIKSHVKSQPIKSTGKASVPRSRSNESISDDDDNSIVKKGGQSSRPGPPKGDFKFTTLPRKDVMQELREKLAQRRKTQEISSQLVSNLEKGFPSKREKRHKLTSQILKETDSYVETIPRIVSADTESTRSHPVAGDANCGANCATFLCLGDSAGPPKPIRIMWQRGDFLTVKEALLALDDSDQWDGASTIAYTRGPTMSVDELSAALATRRAAARAKVPKAAIKETNSLAAVPEVVEEDSIHRNQHEDSSAVADSSAKAGEQKVDARKTDDGASLAYSVGTEDEAESTIDCGSDDSSMVPLRHGQREISKPSIPRIPSDDRVPILSSPKPNLMSQQLISARSSSEELVIALSLSDDSNNLIPSPQSQTNGMKIDHESTHMTFHETTATVAKTPADSAPTGTQSSKKGIVVPSNESHQQELFAKIEEFQKRRSQRMEESEDHDDHAAPHPSVVQRSVQQVPNRTDVVDLPKASKKVAQAYVNALAKKIEGKISIPRKDPSKPQGKTVVQPTKQPTAKATDTMIPAPGQNYNPISITKKLGLDAIHPNPNPKPNSPGMEAPRGVHANTKFIYGKTQTLDSAAAVNVDDLVSRIDSVVHRLIETGKIDPTGSSMEGSDLEQRTLRSNTAELLQNLAILRARRSFGASSRHDQTPMGSGGQSSVPKSFVVTRNAKAGSSSDARLGSAYDSPTIPRVERKNIQDLRAKRDQAANAVRLSAQRLSGMSRDFSENTNILQETTGTRPRSFSSSVKVKGPPKPENFSGVMPTTSASSRPIIPTPQKPPRESFSTIATMSTITKDQRTVLTDDFRGSMHFPITLPDPVMSDMGSWEQEQLQQLPVMLQTTFSGLQGPGGRNTYDFGGDRQERDIYSSSGSEFDTENTSSVGDDETTEYGSDDESARLLRIESMIHELRARRLRL